MEPQATPVMATLMTRISRDLPRVSSPRCLPALFQSIALIPVLWWFVQRLNDGSDEPLGLLTLALAAGILWRDRRSLVSTPGFRNVGALLILISVLGVHNVPPLLRSALAICGIAVWYGIHRRVGLIGLLLLSLPVAASLQFYLGYPLRLLAAEGTVKLLELGSVVVTRRGTQVELAGQVIGVDPACGGVRMLWHALAAAMGLAALHHLTPRATVLAGLLAIALVIPANILRAALLVLKESGTMPKMVLGHGGVGLVSFALVLVPLWRATSSRAKRAPDEMAMPPAGSVAMGFLILAAILAPLMMIAPPRFPDMPSAGNDTQIFTFDGLTLPLARLPASDMEMAFARSFPGTLASYDWEGKQVILRRVTRATRRLHPTRDCLRAAGFATTAGTTVSLADGSEWARFHATRDGRRWTVSERIVSERNHASWTDASSWYWAAMRHPLNGPWQAETVISE